VGASLLAIDCAAVTLKNKMEPNMQSPTHNLPALFKQLGLPDDAESIDKFVATHSPLKPELHLADAFFWSQSQADLLRAEILVDADWAEVVDQLDVMLRKGRGV
jgi:hypothetical protein